VPRLQTRFAVHGGVATQPQYELRKSSTTLVELVSLDVDFFAEESAQAIVSQQVLAQSDVRNPDRIVR
jgi:hypothetical protein